MPQCRQSATANLDKYTRTTHKIHKEHAMGKKRINLSLDEDTEERLRQYSWENHSTMSKAVTDLVWKAKVKNEQVRGQAVIKTK